MLDPAQPFTVIYRWLILVNNCDMYFIILLLTLWDPFLIDLHILFEQKYHTNYGNYNN